MKPNLYLHLFVVLIGFLFSCKSKEDRLFVLVPESHTGILFSNTITEYDTFNILTHEYIFNGGGVGVGDFNLDGKPDLFFTGNQVPNKLYLNLGDFKFQDVSLVAGIEAIDSWCTGMAIVDINEDGWPDIYVCTAMNDDKSKRKNLLFVHQGLDESGIPLFKEEASKYGIADVGNSMGAAFFDYDKDGFLDLYVMNNEQSNTVPGTYREKITDGSAINNDRLYRNNGDGTFSDVTIEAGITVEGFGLGLAIADVNLDGWPDVYIGNDYLANDLLYINNGDGTFSNNISDLIKHQSMFSMGVDINDFNNDGFPDIMVLDMLAETNLRKKTTISRNQYEVYINNERWGFDYQHVRNMLQLNNGPGVPFSEIGQLAGVYQTDWSWSPLFADLDNDGYRDLLITNGFPRDITDKDFMNFRKGVSTVVGTAKLLDSIPIIKIPNYAFKNNKDLTFRNVAKEWGLDMPSFSNGAVFVDLDGDGDLDYVINNINEPAFIWKNQLNEKKSPNAYLRVKLIGNPSNPSGIGSKVVLRLEDGSMQVHEQFLTRGYMSSVEDVVHFGIPENKVIQSLEVLWDNNTYQKIEGLNTKQIIEVKKEDAKAITKSELSFPFVPKEVNPIFSEVADELDIDYIHEEIDRIDYHVQRTLMHKLTQFGPSLVVGDINGDGLEDFIVGSSAGFGPQVFVQLASGKFSQQDLFENPDEFKYEEMGMLLFDIDNDGDLDLYMVSGSSEFVIGAEEYKDRVYLNDGKGNFFRSLESLDEVSGSGSVVRAADFDGDGFMDLFVGGRAPLGQFPFPENSFLLKNINGKLQDVTSAIAPELSKVGMVTDALWTDIDGDGKLELMVVGELMPITIFKYDGEKFKKLEKTGLEDYVGWWNSIVAGDFDQDGDMDYVVGNMGSNNYFHPSKERPVSVYGKDFDRNGSIDPIYFAYFKDEQGEYTSVPVHFWDDLFAQSTLFRRKFLRYKYYAKATEENLFSPAELEDVLILRGNYDRSSYIENLGNGKFKVHELPILAQFAPVNGMIVDDVNGDGNLDVLMVGNDFGNEVFSGRHDALNGLVLLGDGKGGFEPVKSYESGFLVPKDAKSAVMLTDSNAHPIYLASQNRGPLKVFKHNKPLSNKAVKVPQNIHTLKLEFEDGKVQKVEFRNRSGFLSNGGNVYPAPSNVIRVVGLGYDGYEIALGLN